ncbi:MAG: methyltransferase domain-containing protein [Pseudomonadota bacterium]
MSNFDSLQLKWDRRHADPQNLPKAADVLLQNQHLLPSHGKALDLACGLGGNALLLARAGLEVSAWDLSPVAIERLQAFADEQGLVSLRAEVRDVEGDPPAVDAFDVIAVSYFLNRSLIPALIASLRQGGLILYQTFTRIALTEQGPSNPDYRLGDNELLDLFSPLAIRFYREENRLGDPSQGVRDVAMLVGERTRV